VRVKLDQHSSFLEEVGWTDRSQERYFLEVSLWVYDFGGYF